MKTINELIAEGNIDEATDVLYTSVLYLINNFVPNVQLSKDEFNTLAPKLIEKMQTPVSEGAPSGPTTEPGDDVVVTKTKADLVVKFAKGEGVTAKIPDTYKRTYPVGKPYSYAVPKVDGCTPSQETVSGTMVAEGVEVTVTYNKTIA